MRLRSYRSSRGRFTGVIQAQRAGDTAFGGRNRGVVQRAGCTVYVGKNGGTLTERGSGDSPRGGRGGVSHAEQKAYAGAKSKIKSTLERLGSSESAEIEFDVSQVICDACCKWFDTTLYDEIMGWKNKGTVTIKVTANGGSKTLVVGGANWGAVGEGY